MALPDCNYRMSGGSFNKRVRVLQTFSIHHDKTNNNYYVTDDKNGRKVGFGLKSVDDAIKMFKHQDEWRTRLY